MLRVDRMQSLATLLVTQAYQCWRNRSALLVDIRHISHFNAAHVFGAVHLTNSSWSTFIQQYAPAVPIMVLCYHGISSQKVARVLMQQGFESVYNIQGGFERWVVYYPNSVLNRTLPVAAQGT